MGSQLSKLKNANGLVVTHRPMRRSDRCRSSSNDTTQTQPDVYSSSAARTTTTATNVTRSLKIRNKWRHRSDTMPESAPLPHDKSQHSSHRLSQVTARTSITDPDGALRRFSTPVELAEADRFDQQHYFLQQVTGLTMHVPIEQPRKCLDLATGTGIWVLEASSQFPNCEFLGVDVNSRSLPRDLMPSNCRFEQVDITKHLPFASDSFDYIRHHWLPISTAPMKDALRLQQQQQQHYHHRHGSDHSAGVERKLSRGSTAAARQQPSDDWELHLNRCYNVCAPSGWLELMGTDAYIHNGSFVAHRFNGWMSCVEQKRRARLRRQSGIKEKRGSSSNSTSTKFSGITDSSTWPAFSTPATTPSIGSSVASTPIARSPQPTALPLSSIAIASSELPSAAGPAAHASATESSAASRLALQMLEGGWRDVRHRSWCVPLGGADALGVASWRYIASLVASRRAELLEIIREEIQKNEANLAALAAANAQRPVVHASPELTPLKASASFDTAITTPKAAAIARRMSNLPSSINTQNMPLATATETASPLAMTPTSITENSRNSNSSNGDDRSSGDPSILQALPPTPFTSLTTAAAASKAAPGSSVKSVMHMSVAFMERARSRLLGSDGSSAIHEVAEQELNRVMHALEQEIIACQAYIVLTVIIGRKRPREM
ncbi:hypothetical protein SYNPS1DRAFT_26606 [Syncephalis pseudoplumigaleata]|uniref:Methyltransferase domain-containing protein n=1 Tax=Syncephalis pseudoplumigaleata TaxID=1712513 RepID=A0A4P9Z796_9FUNG|nr:hypothetical protein SYNPS1DRAFT_26606 [Syncephalis pseudoplumigaleata]|eukprot:RKP27761.1 hypothetical protein SYNPS1DRAFT_26606 [Syncephalis pseudoplumigaleata]